MYAVIDLETTGLWARRHDRIVEVAVVQLDTTGAVEGEWSSLVNPGRDLGPQYIHGIQAADVLDAPTFDQIAGHLARLLAGRVMVAHNLRFEVKFLANEYRRIGVPAPINSDHGLCTMDLAAQYLPGARRRLVDCCARAGVDLVQAHSALGDARAAAGLLVYYLRREGQPPPWEALIDTAAQAEWPELPATVVHPVHRAALSEEPEHFLSRLVADLPRVGNGTADAYLDLLDRALLDRHLSATESRGLRDFANRVGLGRTQVVELHERYLAALAAAALADGVISEAERADLEQVTDLLGLEPAHLDKALHNPDASTRLGRFAVTPGDIVVFTGQLDEPREVWEEYATAVGLVPRQRVTKRTHLVVAADPDSLSGKAQKARDYRIPIVDVATFLKLTAGQEGH